MLSPTPSIDRPRLHPGTGYLIAPRVPHGLAAVVEGLTREVLRHRPEDIYVFAAHHFEKLLKLREQYHTEEYSGRECDHEFTREFNLWPTRETKEIRKSSKSSWSLEKEVEIIENRKKASNDVVESRENVSTDRENRKASKQTKDPSTTKRISKKLKENETMSEARATRIISHMSALHGPGKNIQTKDIKQELRKNKISGDKAKATNGVEKGVRGERRSKTRISRSEKSPEEEADRATTSTTTTTSSSRTSARRSLKKVRRIETESETETEREVAAKPELENNRSSVKSNSASCETIVRTESRERRSEARLSAHSSERKVLSRALSMDRIRAYVLRKFASTASLEVLRSPTYVEQVQEVIDRAAPIIKEKLEEIRRPRGKRSRSVDLAWNDESFRQDVRDGRKGSVHEEEAGTRKKSGNGSESDTKKEENESSPGKDEIILNAEREKKKARKSSGSSGKRSRRRKNSSHGDLEVVDQVDGSSKHSDKSEHESDATHDTLEARLTATQNILEDISKSTCELGGARKIDSAGSEPAESEVSDHANISLPVVRPPSSKNSRSATKNGSDNLTLPPISPEAPKSTKKKDDLSLPVLPAANGNHSARKSQEQDVSKDADEASTTRDITSDIEDIAILPEDVIVDAKKDSASSDRRDLISDVKIIDEEKREKDVEEFPRGNEISAEKRGSLEEFEELEQLEKEKTEEVFKDSLNVTPEVLDVPSRPDSLEPDDQGEKLQDDDLAQGNAFDGLKNKLIEIEMAERSIEKALAGQQITTYDGGKVTSRAEKSMIDGATNEAGESANEVEEAASEIEKSTDEGKILMNKDNEGEKKDDDKKRKQLANEKIENIIEISIDKPESSSNRTERSTDKMEEKVKDKMTESTSETENLSTTEKSTNEVEQTKNKVETSINKIENLTKIVEESVNEIKKSTNKTSEEKISKNGTKSKHAEILESKELTEDEKSTNKSEKSTNKTSEEKISKNGTKSKHHAEILESKELTEDEKSTNRSEKSTNKKLSNGAEEAVKVHVKDAQSINSRSLRKGNISETVVCETDDDNITASKSEAKDAPNELSKASTAGNAAIESEISMTNLPGESGKTKERRKRETGKSLATSPLSLDIPYSYVLSEGSPCEIPDSVTTVIIPDRPCSSPVILEDDNSQLASTEESLIRSNITNKISQDEARKKDRAAYGMEAFGEYVHPEVAVLPADIDFVRGKRGVKASPDILIAHQDLDRIKEEGEEEEEKEDEGKETEIHREKEDDKQTVVQDKEKLAGTLENIAEHENEETEKVTPGFKDTEEILPSDVPEQGSPPGTVELIADINSTDEGKVDVAVECKSTLENSSEESGSTQDTRTTTSSDVKESTASNRSGAESPSTGGPIVPELNLDSLLDNTVSSFKMTANDTVTKEDNGSAKESDTTMSLIEPLTSDEMNRLILADAEEDLVAEELTESLLRELQAEEQAAQLLEADQSYREEHAEYERLEKDPLHETNLNVDVKFQDSIGLSEDAQVAQASEEKEKELDSEEEIAKELISSLDKDMQICVEELKSPKEESKDNGKDVKSNSDVNDKSNQSVHAITIDEPKKKEHKVSLEKIETLDKEKDAKTEIVSESSSSVADNKDKDIAITNKEAEESKLETKETETEKAAPLAQFEQELLDQNSRSETADKKTVESESDANAIDNQEKLEDKQANIKVLENKSNENVSKIEESKHEENYQEKLQDQKEELNNREEREREKSEIQEECEQKKLKLNNAQKKNSQENLESQEKIVDVQAEPLETAESKKSSINDSKDDDKHEETKLIKYDEFDTNDQIEKQVENEKKEKTENLPPKIENVHGPITSTISIQSSKDHSRGYWTMDTKSSTVETVVEVNDPNTSTDEKTETVADTPKIIEDESLARKKDDVYSAVLKIQACTRGFLVRRNMRKNLNSKPVSKNEISSTQKTAMDNHLLPQDRSNVREVRTGRQRLQREEALRNNTLSLENAFATGRLQHTGEFHDSVPLPLFDITNSGTNSTPSDDSLSKEVEEDPEQSDVAKSNTNNSDSTHGERGGIFQKRSAFTDSFPIVMHLLADASRNFGVNQSRPDFNANNAEVKPMESALDILMMGYPRDDDNRYLNFITSVEDLGCNMDSLPLDDAMKSSKNVDDVQLSTTSGEGSLREPLALPGTPQGVVIEEVTSLESEIPSESTKPSTAPRTSLDTNSSMPLEERTPEDEKNDLDMSPRTADATGDRKHADEEQNSDCNPENATGGGNLHANKKSNEISRDNHVHTNGKQNEKNVNG